MKKNYVSNAETSARMFKNDFLESLSKIHFSVPLFIYVPVVLYSTYKAFTNHIGIGHMRCILLSDFLYGLLQSTFCTGLPFTMFQSLNGV